MKELSNSKKLYWGNHVYLGCLIVETKQQKTMELGCNIVPNSLVPISRVK